MSGNGLTRLIASASAVCLSAGLTFADPAPTKSLSELVADLQNAQTRLAHGDDMALRDQAALLQVMARALATMDGTKAKPAHVARATVIYLLSGGSPRPIIDRAMDFSSQSIDDRLVRGTLAYVLSRQDDARALLSELDPMTLDPIVAGPIAFVQSVLTDPEDIAKRRRLLDEAMLLAPGGLVEEAALRRSIELAGDAGDAPIFFDRLRQYLEHDGASPYALALMERVRADLVSKVPLERSEEFQNLQPLLNWFSPTARPGFLTALARAALLKGDPKVARAAAGMALSLGPDRPADRARARLYGAAASIVETDGQTPDALAQIEPADLASGDRALLTAARDLQDRLHAFADTKDAAPFAPGPAYRDPALDLIKRGEQVLAHATSVSNGALH